jgi:alpha-N-arabinofuranosidase
VSRRRYLELTGTAVAGLVVGGALGYVAKPTVTGPPTTLTSTITPSVTTTVSPPPPVAVVTVDTGRTSGTVDPNIYGHFTEHLGRCIYGGVWVGPDSPIPNLNGFRADVLETVKQIQPPMIRYPGGNFASGYHWQDGIGPRDQRPTRIDPAWHMQESNAFGTDEFMEWCKLVGTEPYICVNAGSGTAEEAAAWVEYCNSSEKTHYAELRATNGSPQPYGVKYWGLGNELYGDWQIGYCPTGREYADRACEFAKLMKQADPSIKLIGVGCDNDDWNYDVVKNSGQWFDYLSIHFYADKRSYLDLMATPLLYEEVLKRTYSTVQKARADGNIANPIGLAVDEWNVWYPEAQPPWLEQTTGLAEGLFTALMFNVFHRLSNIVTLACFAQLVNVLPLIGTRDDGSLYVNPQYLAYLLYAPRTGETVIPCTVETETYESETLNLQDVPYVDATATMSNDRHILYFHLVNRNPDQAYEFRTNVAPFVASAGTATLLRGDSIDSKNYFDKPNEVRLLEQGLKDTGSSFTFELPAHTACVIELKT